MELGSGGGGCYFFKFSLVKGRLGTEMCGQGRGGGPPEDPCALSHVGEWVRGMCPPGWSLHVWWDVEMGRVGLGP
jgi:hypothetical protein